jgi:hypothetical protein
VNFHRNYCLFRFSPAATLLFFLGGCSATQPIKAWQERLTDYTMKEGGGDLNVLRESAELRSSDSVRPAQIRFDHNEINATSMGALGRKQDARGILVGQHSDGGNPAFFFLVGVIDRSSRGRRTKIEDIRLISCRVQDGRHHWNTSDPNPEALSKYFAARLNRPDGREADRGDLSFPGTDDDFRFEVRGGQAQAADTRSGAVWTIPLN